MKANANTGIAGYFNQGKAFLYSPRGKKLAINPNHRGANEYLGELYLKLGDPEKARQHLAKLQGLCPTGCSEYNDLKKAVDTYQAAKK